MAHRLIYLRKHEYFWLGWSLRQCAHTWIIYYSCSSFANGRYKSVCVYIYFIDSGKARGYLWNYVARNEVGLDSLKLLIAAWGYTRPPFSFEIVYWRSNLSNRSVYIVTLVWRKATNWEKWYSKTFTPSNRSPQTNPYLLIVVAVDFLYFAMRTKTNSPASWR